MGGRIPDHRTDVGVFLVGEAQCAVRPPIIFFQGGSPKQATPLHALDLATHPRPSPHRPWSRDIVNVLEAWEAAK
jgi:hypothetical protein